jgi:hypothetical protein
MAHAQGPAESFAIESKRRGVKEELSGQPFDAQGPDSRLNSLFGSTQLRALVKKMSTELFALRRTEGFCSGSIQTGRFPVESV